MAHDPVCMLIRHIRQPTQRNACVINQVPIKMLTEGKGEEEEEEEEKE